MPPSIVQKYLKESAFPHMWCAGCGNGIVLGALAHAFGELDFLPTNTVVVTGIGCWGKADDYIVTNALHTTHGRALSFATGIKAANPELNVVVLMGDGDGATIGGNHLLHAARRNMDLTAIIVNNYNYGMTGGQFSATTPSGGITKTSPLGNPERPLDLCQLTTVAGANYVARETVYQPTQLKRRLKEGLESTGFSFIEVISPCTTLFGPRNGHKTPQAMFAWLKEKALSQEAFAKKDNAAEEGFFPTGVFAARKIPSFLTSYNAMRQQALAGMKQD